MRHGFVTVAAAVPSVRVADTDFNLRAIECQIARAEGMGVEVLCFPELSLTGYTCQDLFRSQLLVDKAEEALLQLLDFTRKLDVISIVGLPVAVGGLLLNCAAVVQKGCLLGIVPKTYLPNYNEFYEKRWFASSRDLRPTEITLPAVRLCCRPTPKCLSPSTAQGLASRFAKTCGHPFRRATTSPWPVPTSCSTSRPATS